MNGAEAVAAWQRFANNLHVEWTGRRRSWADHSDSTGYIDEEALVQPLVFPRFADEFLGFAVGENLAPESMGIEGKPDFRPSDAGTHPFVFETKSSRAQQDFEPWSGQIERYLIEGRPRIRDVVVTNLVGLKVFSLDQEGAVYCKLHVNLRALLHGPPSAIGDVADARALAEFLAQYRFRELSTAEKLERISKAERWNPLLEVTNPGWVSSQLDRVVRRLGEDVSSQIAAGALSDRTLVDWRVAASIEEELRELEYRLGGDAATAEQHSLADYLSADTDSEAGRALQQYEAHAAYFVATRLMVVRIWEDLRLVDELLRDGGFAEWMTTFQGVVSDVVDRSFGLAKRHYPSLFGGASNYSWYEPKHDALVDVLFDLSNTYFGEMETDVLGDVYQRLLERIDRKSIGQFYTPRDVIRMMWELLGLDELTVAAEDDNRELRVLDIATGSGGFLVEAARMLRTRAMTLRRQGAAISPAAVVEDVARGLVGVEIQRFPAYLAEVNLLLQVGSLLRTDLSARLPPLSILCADSMSLHEDVGGEGLSDATLKDLLKRLDAHGEEVFLRAKYVDSHSFQFDVACGNPPYVGEKRAAAVLSRTRDQFPYWERFVAPHLDVLYWFLILGISKLRRGGRFAFITTEYWLRADGAGPLRKFIAESCSVDRLILFGDLKLFPDAPGQHSMVIVGTCLTDRGAEMSPPAPRHPRVSAYRGPNLPLDARGPVLDALREGSNRVGVTSFNAVVSPNSLGRESWAPVVLSPSQHRKRARLRRGALPLRLKMEEGVIATPDRLRRASDAELLSVATLRAVGYPARTPGVFVLTHDETEALGDLSPTEQAVLRPMVNTRDVFPYAVVLPRDPNHMIYLPRTQMRVGSAIDVQQNAPFPADMPNLERHLRRYEPLLRHRVTRWSERRPWWSIHRPRLGTVSRDAEGSDGWAGYALTTRWGSGERLIVGLAPVGTVPASGLHSLYAEEPATAAYVVGLMHSTPVQDLVEGLPPGEIRQEDLQALGLPFFPDLLDAVSGRTLQLAQLVDEMVTTDGEHWPLLAEVLRSEPDLGTLPLDAWQPTVAGRARHGELRNVAWVKEIRAAGAQSDAIASVSVQRDLFGNSIVVEGGTSGRVAIVVSIEDDEGLNALATLVSGIAVTGGRLRDIASVLVPLRAEQVQQMREEHLQALRGRTTEYVRLRREIDSFIGEAL